ncbi:MAG: hypothetical protein WEC59_05480 [Salibacteraceae bacterium]
MKTFLIKTGLFLISLILLFSAAYYLTGSHKPELENDFMAAMIDKHERAEEIGSPKIIIAGGSNVAFNIDSKKIEEEFGLPVVNLGLSVGLGMEFIVNEIMDVAEEGNVVIFSITFFENIDGIYALKRHTTRHFPKAERYFRLNLSEEFTIHSRILRDQLINIGYTLMGRQSDTGTADDDQLFESESIYTRSNFNEYGDFIGHHGLPQVDQLDQRFTFEYSYWEGINQLNRLNEDALKNGYSLYYIYPAYPFSDFERNREVLNLFREDMQSDLKFPILGDLEDSLYDESAFFDTAYHLRQEGVKARTEYFIELMKSTVSAR